MIKKIVTRKHLTTLVLGALLMVSASPVWAADNYWGNFKEKGNSGEKESVGRPIPGDADGNVTYIMNDDTITPSGSEVNYTGMEVYSPNSAPVKVTVTGNYKTTIDNTKGQSMGLIVGKNGVVNLGSSAANEHTFTVTGTGEEVYGISLVGTDSNNEKNKLYVMGTTNITVTHDDTKEEKWTRGISDTSIHASDASTHNTIFEGPVGITVIGNNSTNTDGIYHTGNNNTLTFNNDVGITVSSNKNVFGVSLSSDQSNVETMTNFNNTLTVTASGSSENVNGIYSAGSMGTVLAEFNGAVDVTSTKLGINNTYGTLDFRENADIKAGKIGVKAIGPNSKINFEKGLMVTSLNDDNPITALYAENDGNIAIGNDSSASNKIEITGGIEANGGTISIILNDALGSSINGEVLAQGKDNHGGSVVLKALGADCIINSNFINKTDGKIDLALANENTIKGQFISEGINSEIKLNLMDFNHIYGDFTSKDSSRIDIYTDVGNDFHGDFTSKDDSTIKIQAYGSTLITGDFISNGTSNMNLSFTFDAQIEGDVISNDGSTIGIDTGSGSKITGNFTNNGTGTVKVDSGGSRFDSDFINKNTGTVDLTFNGGIMTGNGDIITGNFTNDGAGKLTVNSTGPNTINGDFTNDGDGSVTVTSAGTTFTSDFINNGTGIIDLTFNGDTIAGKSDITGTDTNAGKVNVTLNNDARWNVTATSILSKLDLSADSVVDLAGQEKKNKTMTIAELHGDGGTFVLGSDVTQNKYNDKIKVTDSFTGKANLALVDTTGSGILKEGAVNTVLATTIKNGGDNDGVFSAVSAETPLYWMDYELSSTDYSSNGNTYTDWLIDMPSADLSRPTTTVDTIMSSAVSSYYAWRNHNDKLMQRLGDLRQSKNEDQGIWARITRDGTEYDNNDYFHNNTSTMQLGYDKVVSRDTKDNYWVAGGAIGYINGSGSYHYGSSDNSGATLSLYGTRMGNKGHYLDLVATIGKYNNHFNSYMTSNFRQDGDYDTLGYSVSAEYGRRTPLKSGWYVEPQMQLTFGHLNSVDYVTTNKVRVDQDGINSAIGRIGFNIGRSVGQKANFYLKANLSHEFGGSGHVAMSTSNQNRNEDLSLDDTWFTYGLGVSAPVNKDSYMYFDIERSTGSDFTTDWQWNAGMRFSI